MSHVTRTPLSRSKVKVVQAALLSAALTRKATAAVSMGTYSAWETTATLRLLGGARGPWAPTGAERGGVYCVAMRASCLNDDEYGGTIRLRFDARSTA